jgi:hypothetical protein
MPPAGVFCADNAVYGDASKYGMARTSYGGATSKLASLTFSKLNVTGLTLNATTGTYSGTILTPGGVVPGGGAVMTPNSPFKFTCGNTGDVKDVYGSAQFVGLGFLTFSTISALVMTRRLCYVLTAPHRVLTDAKMLSRARSTVFIEVFGSPFLRNCSCVLGLLWGYAASAWSRHGHVRYVPLTIMCVWLTAMRAHSLLPVTQYRHQSLTARAGRAWACTHPTALVQERVTRHHLPLGQGAVFQAWFLSAAHQCVHQMAALDTFVRMR